MRLVVLAAAAFASLASASTTSFSPRSVSAPAGVESDDLYAATVTVFTSEGYRLSRADEDAGVVATELSGDDAGARYGWRAVIEGRRLSLAIDCLACEDDTRPASWVADEPRLRHAIFAEAERRAERL
jgi:hypothetical protein